MYKSHRTEHKGTISSRLVNYFTNNINLTIKKKLMYCTSYDLIIINAVLLYYIVIKRIKSSVKQSAICSMCCLANKLINMSVLPPGLLNGQYTIFIIMSMLNNLNLFTRHKFL